MKRWFDVLLSVALVGAWAVVAFTASDATVRDQAEPSGQVQVAPPGNTG